MTMLSNQRVRPPLAKSLLVRELARALRGSQTILDIGCGADSPMKYLAGQFHIEGLDIHEPTLQATQREGFLKRYHLGGALEIDQKFPAKAFDALVALDVIEHLPKQQGYELIAKMEGVARRCIVIFTPNGFVPQEGKTNPWMKHLSGWTVTEFAQMGFSVVGVNGYKGLRGQEARLRWRPRFFWGGLSLASHYLYTRAHPRLAYALFCVKRCG